MPFQKSSPDANAPVFGVPRPAQPLAPAGQSVDCRPTQLPPELSFLSAHGVAPALLLAAARKARAQNVPPEAVLLAEGTVEETFYYRALARHLGVLFIEGPVALARDRVAYPQAIHAGLAPLESASGPVLLSAPRGAALAELLQRGPRSERGRSKLAITTPSNFSNLVRAASRTSILQWASFGLSDFDPDLSAQPRPAKASRGLALTVVALGLICCATPDFAMALGSAFLSVLFLATVVLRLLASAASMGQRQPRRAVLSDPQLPAYSIVVALHREARVVPQLVAALDRIDYPRAKLDIKLVLETDDHETLAALEALRLPPVYEIIVAPAGWPRTKPRALNIALPLLRGEFMTIFDAEDEPDPQQLRLAAERFRSAPRKLACLQAGLVIDNMEDSWLTRLFAIEYAALFDVLIPGLADLGLPLPLGGTSNHFRTKILREVYGWDAWNVTEDADLGIRLARFGYQVGYLASHTNEEAPARLSAWLAQRRRWFKGWMQTALTLSRNPRRLAAELGLVRAGALVLMLTGLVLAPPLWPLCAGMMVYDMATAGLPDPSSLLARMDAALWVAVALFGVASIFWCALLAMRRRRLLNLCLWLPLLLPYQLIMSGAALAALYDLILRPFYWHKTTHGLARTSMRRFPGRSEAESRGPGAEGRLKNSALRNIFRCAPGLRERGGTSPAAAKERHQRSFHYDRSYFNSPNIEENIRKLIGDLNQYTKGSTN